ncbi:hypothetical protein [Stenotrophomonas sp. GD03657]|uniref:hypothetical protein n=1 Tax=Stenotrophomonas sp. GD03657 TaxID=2975363 RepID=UPI002446F7DE|nr:hypothetical protein [Stenotrophomonas sp. GD03657]MDH2154319.1 hypothetical protein [Stenotrophomonas sp. GD03657]
MFSQELDGVLIPHDELNVPRGLYLSWPRSYRSAFDLSLRTLGSRYVDLRRDQFANPGRVPDESGSMMMLQTLKFFTDLSNERNPATPLDLTVFAPFLPMADKVVNVLDQYLTPQGLATVTIDDPVPSIFHFPDAYLEIKWRNHSTDDCSIRDYPSGRNGATDPLQMHDVGNWPRGFARLHKVGG